MRWRERCSALEPNIPAVRQAGTRDTGPDILRKS